LATQQEGGRENDAPCTDHAVTDAEHGELVICETCGELLSFNEAGILTPVHPLEFERLPGTVRAAVAMVAEMRGGATEYLRAQEQLEDVFCRWQHNRPLHVLTARLPPKGIYVPAMLCDVVELVADCDETRELIADIVATTHGRATLEQFRALVLRHELHMSRGGTA
jgi:hypothetical protein